MTAIEAIRAGQTLLAYIVRADAAADSTTFFTGYDASFQAVSWFIRPAAPLCLTSICQSCGPSSGPPSCSWSGAAAASWTSTMTIAPW